MDLGPVYQSVWLQSYSGERNMFGASLLPCKCEWALSTDYALCAGVCTGGRAKLST